MKGLPSHRRSVHSCRACAPGVLKDVLNSLRTDGELKDGDLALKLQGAMDLMAVARGARLHFALLRRYCRFELCILVGCAQAQAPWLVLATCTISFTSSAVSPSPVRSSCSLYRSVS